MRSGWRRMTTKTRSSTPRKFTTAEKSVLLWRKKYARAAQVAPTGDWRVWAICSGRGFGKTRTAAEFVKERGLNHPKARIAVAAPTFEDDVRDVCFEGESGLLSLLPEDSIRAWNRSGGELLLTNGTRYKGIRADVKRKGRGPQWNYLWGDEVGEWRYPEVWDQLMLGLRLGDDPRAIATFTPKPVQLVREILASEDVHITRGSTYDNRANLADNMFREILQKYEGTGKGRQEIYGELLSELPGAMWKRAIIEEHRVRSEDAPTLDDFAEIIVAVDPAGSDDEANSETGIVVCGRIGERASPMSHAYVLADMSGHYTPDGWSKAALDAFDLYEADYVVAEKNQGGAMVKSTLRSRNPNVPLKTVHAKRGKALRADPVVSLDEQGRVHHVGAHPVLEDQMCSFSRDEQPLGSDRVDARVYACSELLLSGGRSSRSRRGLAGGFKGY